MTWITDAQWTEFEERGYLRLGKVLNAEELLALQARIDAIMLGEADVPYGKMLMQLDSATGNYGDAGEQTKGFKGATLDYRKIQDLEFDDLFLSYMQRPIFHEICSRLLGPDVDVAVFRAMFMNKPAKRGTWLPWHQDRWNFLNIDPLLTVWTALDPATIANGCLQVVPGSHKVGIINPSHHSAFLNEAQTAEFVAADRIELVELEAGEVVLLHNWLLHASDVNRSEVSRRAFSVCYMDGATETTDGQRFNVVFGKHALKHQDLEAVRRQLNAVS